MNADMGAPRLIELDSVPFERPNLVFSAEIEIFSFSAKSFKINVLAIK